MNIHILDSLTTCLVDDLPPPAAADVSAENARDDSLAGFGAAARPVGDDAAVLTLLAAGVRLRNVTDHLLVAVATAVERLGFRPADICRPCPTDLPHAC